MKALESSTTTAAAKGNNSNNNEIQGFAEAAGMGVLQNLISSMAAETFEDMYDYECENSSTSTGFHDHDDELEEEDDEGEEEDQGKPDMDRQFHLPRNHPYRLHEQHHYSDDDDDEREDKGKENVGGAREASPLDHNHPAEEREEEAHATSTTITTSVTSAYAADNCGDANDASSSSSSHSECSDTSAPSSPNLEAEDVVGSDSIHKSLDDSSTSQPLLALPHPQQGEQQYAQQHDESSLSTQQTAIDSSTAPPPGLNPKNPSRSHLSIPRSIHFRSITPTDRSPGSGATSPLGRLQIHTVNRLEVENSFLLNQNNSLTRDISHCRQTVQALKQILAQREDTIGRMKQEVHQAHLKMKFMESLLSGQRHHLGQPQQQQFLYQQQQQYQPGLQQNGLEGDWKERHRLEEDDDDEEYDEEVEGEDEGGVVPREEEERGSSSLLDMYAQESEPPFDWLLKGWDEGEMPPAEGDSDIERGHAQDDDEQEEEEEEEEETREILRPVRSIFSGVNDDEQYNSDEYIDDEEDDEEEDEDEEDFRQGKRPRSGEFENRMQGAGIYHHQRSSSGEASALALSMSLSNNSTCILSQCGSSNHNDDDDSDEDDENLDDPCDANDIATAAPGERASGCAFIPGNRPQSPGSLPSPALSESSMSLESHSEGSNGSVTSLSCSSLTSNSSADEKDGGHVLESKQDQQQLQQLNDSSSVEVLVFGASAGDNESETEQQGLQLPAVVPYSSFRDSGHFPTQVFTMDYEEQHLVVVDDVDTDEEEERDDDDHVEDAQESQPSFRPFSPTTTASLLIHNTDSDLSLATPSSESSPSKKGGLATLAAVLFKAKDTPHQVMPLCQPNGSHPCLGASPPMATPLALISLVNIETSASSTTLISASAPSPTAANRVISTESCNNRARPVSVATTTTMATTGGSGIVNWEPNAFYQDLETVDSGGGGGGSGTASDPNRHVSETTSAPALAVPNDSVATTAQDDKPRSSDAVKSEDPGVSTVISPTSGTTWGPSSILKALLPSKRKGKLRSAKSKDKIDIGSNETRDNLLLGGGEATVVAVTIGKEADEAVVVVAKEQSVAWTMLKSQAPLSVVTSVAGGTLPQQEQQQAPIVSESVSPTSTTTLFSRVFGRGGNSSSSGSKAKA
ncbi:hypothetical protein EC991_001782 [Linnemannia zychae]|nr:hypothetical protein EC991_001782 [Linnemannia zychae]